MIDRIPFRILLKFVSLRLLDKLLEAYQPVLVRVRLLEHVLAHPFHLFRALLHVVLGRTGLVHLVQLVNEQHLHLVLIPHVVAVEIVQHEERFRIKVLPVHVILLLPDLLQLRLVSRMVDLFVLVVLFLLLLQLLLVRLPVFLVEGA